MKKIYLVTALAVFGVTANAAILCGGGGGGNPPPGSGVTDVGSNTAGVAGGLGPSSGNICRVQSTAPNSTDLSPLDFSNFTVGASAGYLTATVGISGTLTSAGSSTQVVGGTTFLDFSFGGITGPTAPLNGDILLQYMVTGAINGIDVTFQASPGAGGGNITITEKVCTIQFVNNVCNGVTLANMVTVSTGSAATNSQTFTAQGSPVFILKNIQFNNATTSEIVNSHSVATGVPEPMTISMLGAGLLGLGLLGRRRARK